MIPDDCMMERFQSEIGEQNWRLDLQRKEIERLREEALVRNAVIGKLQADKVALSEMLKRVQEFLGDEHNFLATENLLGRIDILLVRMG